MFLKVLGSAAAEGWPAVFCGCEPCREARRRGGKDLRRRTSYQLGDAIHVDFGPDSYGSMIDFGLDYSLLRHLFITHVHPDHWYPEQLRLRREGFSRCLAGSLLTVYGNGHVGADLAAFSEGLAVLRLNFQPITPFERVSLGDEWSAVGLPASHSDEDELALNYLFTWRDRTVVIGNDTGWWLPEVWDFLQTQKLDVVVMDCTSGPTGTGPRAPETSWVGTHHLNCEWVVEVRDELARRGALAADCTFVANHFSHNGGWLHEDLEEFFVPKGIVVGFDGMEVEL
jgi:phosphoribosyl 1,2-cyclic phosphate phosphodiesterase